MSEKATPDLLASTARWTAAVRAKESRREDRLFNDPWATALAGKEGQEWVAHRAGDLGVSTMTVHPEQFLAERGWKATRTQFGETHANYGRWSYPLIPRVIPNMPREWLVTAQKIVLPS